MLVIIDSNIFVSGLLGSKTCRRIFTSFKEGEFDLAISDILFEELKFVLERPKFHLLIDPEEKQDTLSFIKSHAIFVRPKETLTICRDIKDNKILESALAAKCNFITTIDKDLLVLSPFNNIPIISATEFLRKLRRQR